MQLCNQPMIGPAPLGEGRKDLKAEEAHRFPTRPAEEETQHGFTGKKHIEDVVDSLRGETDPTEFRWRQLVAGDQPPDDPGYDHRCEDGPEGHMGNDHQMPGRSWQETQGSASKLADDEKQRRPMESDCAAIIMGTVITR